uniref:Uncharacterized protein n=1 Tax=Opuntia streptacantha TaxID=393608 RepID=A0A7C8ZZV7_OPUST
MNLRKRKKEPPDLPPGLYGSLFGGRSPSDPAMSLLLSEYTFLRHPYPGPNLCHSSVHPFCSNLLYLQRSDLSLHIPTGFRSSVLFGSYAWPSHPLVPASSASQIGPNLGCVGLGDSQQSSRGCRWVYGMPQFVDSAATSAHLKEIGRCSPNLSQGLYCCSEQAVTEGQMLTAFKQATGYMTNGRKAQLKLTAEYYLKPTAAY